MSTMRQRREFRRRLPIQGKVLFLLWGPAHALLWFLMPNRLRWWFVGGKENFDRPFSAFAENFDVRRPRDPKRPR